MLFMFHFFIAPSLNTPDFSSGATILIISFISSSEMNKGNPFPVLTPPGMRRCNNVLFRSHIGRDVTHHAETSAGRRNQYIKKTDLFEVPLQHSSVT